MSNKCKLTELDISYNGLADEATALFEFLSYIKNLHKLKMIGCIKDHFHAGRALANLLTKENENCQLTELHLFKTDLTNELGPKYLSDALMSDKCKLTTL
jgi:hypothetical protein